MLLADSRGGVPAWNYSTFSYTQHGPHNNDSANTGLLDEHVESHPMATWASHGDAGHASRYRLSENQWGPPAWPW